jgi:hypothetical protein
MKQTELGLLGYVGVLSGLFFYPEDGSGSDMFLQNVCWLLTGYMTL